MNDMPRGAERIWAWTVRTTREGIIGMCKWSPDPPPYAPTHSEEYVRADLYETRTAEMEAFRDDSCRMFGDKILELCMNHPNFFSDEWSEDIMPIAVDAGLARRVEYDEVAHGYIEDAQPGEEIWLWN